MLPEPGRPLTVVQDGNLSIVRFAIPALDKSNVQSLGRELDRLATAPGSRMHLDLTGVGTWLCRGGDQRWDFTRSLP
jgi:hypothetical protein